MKNRSYESLKEFLDVEGWELQDDLYRAIMNLFFKCHMQYDLKEIHKYVKTVLDDVYNDLT
jgi:hypothetical protein